MPSSCSVPLCDGFGGHRFPRNQTLRQKWITAIRRSGFIPSENCRVCKKHFTKDDYKLPNDSSLKHPGLILKKNSIPSLFSWNDNTSAIQKKKINTKSTSYQKCSVLNCKSGSSKNLLHSCPNQEGTRKKWAEVFKVNKDVVKNILICSQHFLKTDYVNSRNEETKVLKRNAVPSQKLPRSRRLICIQKDAVHSKKKKIDKRTKKMTDVLNQAKEDDQKVNVRECRACLNKMDDNASVCNIFQSWMPPWTGMAASIAEDLAKLANVEITETDNYPNNICGKCYQKLLDAATFAANVRVSDNLLRQRYAPESNNIDKIWPKPIQIDKNLNSVSIKPELEIKQEVVDDEYELGASNSLLGVDNNLYAEMENLDIKTEPEDFIEPPPLTVTINDTMSLNPLSLEYKTVVNGTGEYEAIITDCVHSTAIFNGNMPSQYEEHLDVRVKQELHSDEDVEQVPDLPLECLLCTKSFNSVTGLKAHVITQHSYKSVKRKPGREDTPKKKQKKEYKCGICGRWFATSTDLLVHETCHNKHSCYVCSRKFDTFKQLSKHRKQCTVPPVNAAIKPKTLDDVIRQLKEEADSNTEDSNDSNMKLHLEIHSNSKTHLNPETELNANVNIRNIKGETT